MSAAKTINVELGSRAYNIHIGPGLLQNAGRQITDLRANVRCASVSDENVMALHGDALQKSLSRAGIQHSSIIIAPGERSKDWSTLMHIVGGILDAKLERGDLVIAFGGGVVGDLAGFAAAI